MKRSGDTVRAHAIYSTCKYPEAAVRLARLRNVKDGRARRGASRSPSSVPTFELSMAAVEDRSVEYCVRDQLLRASAEGEGNLGALRRERPHQLVVRLAVLAGGIRADSGRILSSFSSGTRGLITRRILRPTAARIRCLFRRTGERHVQGHDTAALRRSLWDIVPPSLRGAWSMRACWPWRSTVCRRSIWPCGSTGWCATSGPVRRVFLTWCNSGPHTRRYRLVEVKAPGDRLQDNQRACLEYMMSHRMPVSVCRVKWIDAADGPGAVAHAK